MRAFLFFSILSLIAFSCKKYDAENECTPLTNNEDADFRVFPKTGIWVKYWGKTSGTSKKSYDTIKIGQPITLTLTTINFGYDSTGIDIPVTRLYYPVIRHFVTVDTTQNIVTNSSINTIAYIREDVEKNRLFQVSNTIPIDSAKKEFLLFDYSLPAGSSFFQNNSYPPENTEYNVTAVDSIYFCSRYLKRTYITNYFNLFDPNPANSPNIQGFHLGLLNESYSISNMVWRKLIYKGQELKITYRLE